MIDSRYKVNHDSKDALIVGLIRQPTLLTYLNYSTIRFAVVEATTKAAIISLLFTIPRLSVQL